MNQNPLSVREAEEKDFSAIIDYFLNADEKFLLGMGVDSSKLLSKPVWTELLKTEYNLPSEAKKIFFLIWESDGKPVGHSNINKIIFGESAYMHLHLWNNEIRKKGSGTEFARMSLPFYFKNFQLKKIFSEPYALNPAPNKVLEKTGFAFIKKYTTIPGWINFEQEVNHWEISVSQYYKLPV